MSDTPVEKIRIWDAPVRVFHWLLVLSFAGAYLTAESEVWRLLHVTLGYTLGGLLAFRLVWGVVGTRYARFGNFVRGPGAVMRYLQSIKARQPEHHLGHNPAGAVAIVLLLLLGLGVTASGYVTYNDLGPGWVAELHDLLANAMVVVVGGHLLGVVAASLQHRENLVRAMVTGCKLGPSGQGIARSWGALAVAMVLAVLGFWWWQYAHSAG
ncbi:MAG: cytochrome b/b6 domain-containing protein [Rhodoferax sp.]|nr:cytochrome b/b6 domain-containing protein [Rhodoferax sp.]